MKPFIIIALTGICVSLFAPVSQPRLNGQPDAVSRYIAQNLLDRQDQTPDELGEDEDTLFYEQAIISRELFQISLPPLTAEQKIIWAYRMSEADLFL